MKSALDVAKHLLTKSHPDAEDYISNLKLQKLLYYTQGVFTAMHDAPIFEEAIEAWEHGPVVPAVYHHFKGHGAGQIMPQPEYHNIQLDDREKNVMAEVYKVFGQFSAWKLRNMTHAEDPWKNTPQGEIIDLELIKSYFKRNVVK